MKKNSGLQHQLCFHEKTHKNVHHWFSSSLAQVFSSRNIYTRGVWRGTLKGDKHDVVSSSLGGLLINCRNSDLYLTSTLSLSHLKLTFSGLLTVTPCTNDPPVWIHFLFEAAHTVYDQVPPFRWAPRCRGPAGTQGSAAAAAQRCSLETGGRTAHSPADKVHGEQMRGGSALFTMWDRSVIWS